MSECKTIQCPICNLTLDETFVSQKCPRCQTIIESEFMCGSCHNCHETITIESKTLKQDFTKNLISKFISKLKKI